MGSAVEKLKTEIEKINSEQIKKVIDKELRVLTRNKSIKKNLIARDKGIEE